MEQGRNRGDSGGQGGCRGSKRGINSCAQPAQLQNSVLRFRLSSAKKPIRSAEGGRGVGSQQALPGPGVPGQGDLLPGLVDPWTKPGPAHPSHQHWILATGYSSSHWQTFLLKYESQNRRNYLMSVLYKLLCGNKKQRVVLG